MNKVILIGNLASDPELKRTAGDISVCSFRLAVQRRRANPQGVREADFFTITAWRALAENCAKYLAKGKKCAVEGSIITRSWDGQDGVKRYATEIVAEEVEFLSPKGAEGYADAAESTAAEGFTEVPQDDDLPF